MTIWAGLKKTRPSMIRWPSPASAPMNSAPTMTKRARPKPTRSATTMPGSEAGSTTRRTSAGARRAEAGGGAQEHHVDPEHAGRDGDEHREEGRVADEGDLRGLPEPEPDEEHRQEGQRRDRPDELDRPARASGAAARTGRPGCRARARPTAARPKPWATRRSDTPTFTKRLAVAHHRDAGRRDVGGRRQEHGVDDLEARVAVGDESPTRRAPRGARRRGSLVHLRHFFLDHARDLALVLA